LEPVGERVYVFDAVCHADAVLDAVAKPLGDRVAINDRDEVSVTDADGEPIAESERLSDRDSDAVFDAKLESEPVAIAVGV
jgi:hypothetical protein